MAERVKAEILDHQVWEERVSGAASAKLHCKSPRCFEKEIRGHMGLALSTYQFI